MSLEEKVDALTSAIAGLTVAMHAQLAALGGTATEAHVATKKEATKTAAKAAPKKEEPAKAELVVSFEDLKQAVVAAADKDKPATSAALKKLNVAKISELKEEQYEEALALLKAVVAETSEPPQESSFV